ncbi:MAG: restriction endonuclease subunit R [Gammaproteobacteria bacterium]|nr:restriction endonuclease subunit R [Gammaproteobacteria bacterium]MYD03020.1 restriction endonuclease subunit R [Gammaproteobacteria bacterium]MYI25643.1 restriction endonuclease subunit R [Gammaproteobacteria bacterium]
MPTRTTRRDSGAGQAIALEQRLMLLAWLHQRLGYKNTRELLADLAQVDEGFDADGRSHALARLVSRSGQFRGINADELKGYDQNIRISLAAMNEARAEPITLRYFQYLAALYAEIYLDHRWNRTGAFLDSLNESVRERNLGRRPSEPTFHEFGEADLDKLAFWMATGSGKTLLLHLNYQQFLCYNSKPLDNIILITPNEGLSEQHLAEMAASNIPCRRFELDGRPAIDAHTVQVTEITKLVMEKRGEGQSVPVEAFEGNNLIFVDEGHKGSGGEAWRQVRDAIGATGFTFEYSATFGQALTAARNDALTAEYGKAIVFDYSYRHFYKDGHGKDFNILNLLQDPGDHTDMLLLANLLAFHEQQAVFRDEVAEMRHYNIEQPLWTLVGASVNAVYSENRRKRSDVLIAIRLLHRFLSDRAWAVAAIGQLLTGNSGLRGVHGDLLEGKFDYLTKDPAAIYEDILACTLHSANAGGLLLCDIKDADGELGLKVAGSQSYFGVIYIGDTAAFKKLVIADGSGIAVEVDAISGSLFEDINRPGTTIEILIGARKFMEGWNSWRVSNMGLLNIGRSEGAQIIQLFGRGVRLRGLDMTLKRSAALRGAHPAHIRKLETLNIFALRANYMTKFREYLEREGMTTEESLELHLPIRVNDNWLSKDLVVPRLDDGRDYKSEKVSILETNGAGIRVSLEVAGRAQAITSGDDISASEATSGKGGRLPAEALDLVDWNAAYLELVSHTTGRGFDNLAIEPRRLRGIMENPTAYDLFADERLTSPSKLRDIEDLQHAVVTILRKYADRQHLSLQARWESGHMRYRTLDEADPNLQFNLEVGEPRPKYIVHTTQGQAEMVEEIQRLAESDALYYSDKGPPLRIHFDRHLYQPLLIEQAGGATGDIRTFPPSLHDSERTFVEDLRDYWAERQRSSTEKTEVFLLRNLSKGRGVGFFDESGFYPDFILWFKAGSDQRIVFIEPHGMVHAGAYDKDYKARLHERLPALAQAMTLPPNVSSVTLDSFIVSATPYEDLRTRYDDGSWSRQRFAEKHILFQEDRGATGYDYIEAIFRV